MVAAWNVVVITVVLIRTAGRALSRPVPVRGLLSRSGSSEAGSVQTGLDEGSYAMNAHVEIVRSDVGHVAYKEREALAAFHHASRIVAAEVLFKRQAVLSRRDGSAHDRLDFAFVADENPTTYNGK